MNRSPSKSTNFGFSIRKKIEEFYAPWNAKLAEYGQSSDPVIAAHGRWLGDRIRRHHHGFGPSEPEPE